MKIKEWLKIKGGDKVKINDDKVDVVSVIQVNEQNNLGQFVFCKCKEKEGEFYLFAKIVDQEIDVRIYNEISWIGTGDRRRLLDNGFHILFQSPKDSNNFNPCDLEWTESFSFVDNGKDVWFNKKANFHGETEDRPKLTGIDVSIATVTEYAAVEQATYPEVIILELGGIDITGDLVPNGGIVIPLEGNCIDNDKVKSIGWF